jgi:valyl-tRNA synthetase
MEPRASLSPQAPISDRYEPAEVEKRWYPVWEERGYFRADPGAPGKPFSIVMPPPNVTGALHWGHALDNTLQDVLARMKRMDGCNTLWLPGTDHASIAVHMVLDRQLAAEGKTKEDLGREAFLARAWKWKEEAGGTITRQLRRLGASCDWTRERFTMDPGLARAVREAFVRLWEEGLIYRDDYIVNWCPRCQTVLSDIEVEREERDDEFVYIKYGPVTLGTVRPETKLGDTGLAVHPKDKRYAHLVGQTLEVPSVDGTVSVRVVADDAVDPKFGTGVIKVTPGHDPVDFEIGRRHHLPVKTVIGFDGRMTAEAGRYAGLDRFECRKRIVEDMKALGLIERIEPYRHAVGVCYRCKTVVEPLISKQWYLQVRPLAEAAIKAVREGRVKILPRSWTKTYYHWMENIRPWCISRQLWWGHRIPAWHCDADGSIHVSRDDLTSCPTCGGSLRQDPDTLDTWFSSGLWPFSTMGWPDVTADLRTYYPTSVLITGPDILFFWVARMAMLGIHFMQEVPFRDVYLHAIVRDAEGQKMSKSRGNVADPLEVMAKYGTDAFRGAHRGLPELRQQDLERRAPRAIEPGGFRRGAGPEDPAGAGRRVDREPAGGDHRGGAGRAPALPVQRRRVGDLPLSLARVLRLVPRDRQALALPSREPGAARADPGDARSGARDDAPPSAPVHAVHHRGDLAAAPAQGRLDHDRAVSAGGREAARRPGRARDDRGHGPRHRAAQHPR